jgi:hypothetical protein
MADTAKHLKAFRQIIDEIALRAPEFVAICHEAEKAVAHTVAIGNLDAALERGSAVLERMTREHQRLMTELKVATRNLLGERPRIGESDLHFFERISRTDADGWLRMAANNGVRLDMGITQ